MRQCTQCQAELPERAQFCSRCGTPAIYDEARPGDDITTDEEQREDTRQAEPEETVSAEEAAGPAASAEESALTQEEKQSEALQQPEAIAPAEEASAGEREEIPTNEPATASEGPEEDSPETAISLAPAVAEERGQDSDEAQPAVEQTDLETTEQSDQGARSEEDTQPEQPFASIQSARRQNGTGRGWLVIALVALLVLAAGAGAFAFIRQQTSAGASSQCTASQQAGCANTTTGSNRAHTTRLAFSGSISGPMTVSAQVRCQATTTQNLRTLMVTISGTVGEQLYNFGFVINNYTGPGTYTATPPSLTILLDVPGDATNNGWSNASTTDSGTITVARGEQAGSITYVLSGFGTRAGTQVQISGNWTCG